MDWVYLNSFSKVCYNTLHCNGPLNWSLSVVLQASALQAAAFHPDGSSVAVGFKKGG